MSNIFYEGQAVGCLVYGEGVVKAIYDTAKFKFLVQFEHLYRFYTESGQYYTYARPTLYPIEQYRAIIANLPAPQPDAWKPKPGEWCWFWDSTFDRMPMLGKFKAMCGEFYASELDQYEHWEHCAPFIGELPEHLKEVQP